MFPIFSKASHEINWRALTKYKSTLIEKSFQPSRKGKTQKKTLKIFLSSKRYFLKMMYK